MSSAASKPAPTSAPSSFPSKLERGPSTKRTSWPLSPLVTATLQAAFLSFLSNVLAQSIKCIRDGKEISLSAFDRAQALQFTVFAILSTPPNFVWQEYLEIWFPSSPSSLPSPSPSKAKILTKKFLTDQLIASPLNSLLFVVFMNRELLGGGGGELAQEFWQLHRASMKVWPAVALISFLFVPVEKRVVFGSLVALGWNVYLGLVMG